MGAPIHQSVPKTITIQTNRLLSPKRKREPTPKFTFGCTPSICCTTNEREPAEIVQMKKGNAINNSVFKTRLKLQIRKLTYFNEPGGNIIEETKPIVAEQGESGFLKVPSLFENVTSLNGSLVIDPFKTGNKHFYNMHRPAIYYKR